MTFVSRAGVNNSRLVESRPASGATPAAKSSESISMPSATPPSSGNRLLASARREAVVTATVWLAALVYTVGYCVRHGYGRAADSVTYWYGFPDWIFWGIVVPWLLATLVTAWFTFSYVEDHVLGDDDTEHVTDDPDLLGGAEKQRDDKAEGRPRHGG